MLGREIKGMSVRIIQFINITTHLNTLICTVCSDNVWMTSLEDEMKQEYLAIIPIISFFFAPPPTYSSNPLKPGGRSLRFSVNLILECIECMFEGIGFSRELWNLSGLQKITMDWIEVVCTATVIYLTNFTKSMTGTSNLSQDHKLDIVATNSVFVMDHKKWINCGSHEQGKINNHEPPHQYYTSQGTRAFQVWG